MPYRSRRKVPERFLISDNPHLITQLLTDWSGGDRDALEQLMPLVYKELRRMAHGFVRGQPAGHSFQATELIHEAYLKLAAGQEPNWQNRSHFFGDAAKATRHILIDYARSKQARKRADLVERVTLKDNAVVSAAHPQESIALDDALQQLALPDERKSRVVEMKFFGGLSTEEIHEVLKISAETVERDWRFART